MNIIGVIRDSALRERLGLLAADAGWRCLLCGEPEELRSAPLSAEAVQADLLVTDDPDETLNGPGIAFPGRARVLLASAGTDGAHGAEESGRSVVDPGVSDAALIQALNTCVNAHRLRQRFAELERTEPITSLPRRDELFDALSRHKGSPLGLLVVQIDHASHLYDKLDPVSKTDLLAAMGSHLQSVVPPTAALGFYDAACFIVALPRVTEAALAQAAEALVGRVRVPLHYRGGELHVTASVGFEFNAMYTDPARLWSQAWRAMRGALEQGGNRAAGGDVPGVSSRLPQALVRDEFSLVLQPQVSVSGQRLTGAETLLRWQGMEVGELAPSQFIPVAEQSGHMARIGDWVLDRACQDASSWLEHLVDPLILGINVSPQQFHHAGIVDRIGRWRSERWFDPAMLELELPMDAMLTLVDDYRTQLYRLRDWGVRFALDNLGSTLIDAAKLLRCPADTLKIDRSLIARMEEDDQARELVAQICHLGERFDLRVVAVGVERPSQFDMLENLGCTDVQGFLFSAPVSLAQFRSLLARELEGRIGDLNA